MKAGAPLLAQIEWYAVEYAIHVKPELQGGRQAHQHNGPYARPAGLIMSHLIMLAQTMHIACVSLHAVLHQYPSALCTLVLKRHACHEPRVA